MASLAQSASRIGATRRRPWGARQRGLSSALLALLCVSMGLGAGVGNASAKVHVNASQQLAVLNFEHGAYQYPRTSSRLEKSIPARAPITGEPTTLPVLAQLTDRHGRHWLKVMLPGRPNSSTGWIHRGGTQEAVTIWNIHVNTASRHVWVYRAGKLVKTFSAVVGKPSTPTPTGKFFVEESMIMPVSDPGGPFALALSARSDVLQQFDGGPGQIGIHGRDSLGGTIGQAESHGCVRLVTADITWLIRRIPIGTPVEIF